MPALEEVAAALDAGDRVVDIARRAGCSPRSIRNVAHRGGLALPQARLRAVRDARLTDAAWLRDCVEQRGASPSGVARELAVGILEVHTALTAAGVAWTGRRPPTYPQLYVKGWLAEQFAAGGSVRSIAETVGCSASAVRHAADKLGISRRRFAAPTFPQLHDPEWLRERYVVQGQTSQQIAALIGCTENSVLRALHAAAIPTRPGRPPRRFPELHDARWVRRRYVTERATSAEIAAELGCSLATVTKALRRAQVPVRGNRRFPQLASRAWLRRAIRDRPAHCGTGRCRDRLPPRHRAQSAPARRHRPTTALRRV